MLIITEVWGSPAIAGLKQRIDLQKKTDIRSGTTSLA